MKNKDLIKTLHAHSGPVMINVLIPEGVIYAQVIKSKLIDQIQSYNSDRELFDSTLVDDVLFLDATGTP